MAGGGGISRSRMLPEATAELAIKHRDTMVEHGQSALGHTDLYGEAKGGGGIVGEVLKARDGGARAVDLRLL